MVCFPLQADNDQVENMNWNDKFFYHWQIVPFVCGLLHLKEAPFVFQQALKLMVESGRWIIDLALMRVRNKSKLLSKLPFIVGDIYFNILK